MTILRIKWDTLDVLCDRRLRYCFKRCDVNVNTI